MVYFNTIIPVAFHVICLVTGSTGCLFILTVQFVDWMKTHKLVPVDVIIVSIGFINLLLQGSFAFNEICVLLFVEFLVQIWVVNPIVVIVTSLAFSSLWCSTTLCFYYYVKIINFNGTIFYKFKAKLPVIIRWLLIFSNVISWITALPAYWDIDRQDPFPTDNDTILPLTYHLNFKSKCDCMFHVYMVLSAMAFTIILFTAGTIIMSLHKHIIQLKKNNEGLSHTKLSAHISAAKTVTSLLVLYLIFYATLNVIYTSTQDVGSIKFIVSSMVTSSFPTANSVILIFGNRKLSSTLMYVLGVNSVSGNTEISVKT
ncbi:hypothetical protein GDO81_027312 [Engystomops pustulosus]|uniref:Taste receptor type 2 n=1 Tax=Engystomops pustulosus TaxID=76066 RepID=A0AAV6ZMM0_ENGPU|nr:hypothetical protein GDO81_027312 [Engystomops pustulosus]